MARTIPPAAANTVRVVNIFVFSVSRVPFIGNLLPLMSSYCGCWPCWGQTSGHSPAGPEPRFQNANHDEAALMHELLSTVPQVGGLYLFVRERRWIPWSV